MSLWLELNHEGTEYTQRNQKVIMQAHLVVLPGDGIGPEVTACAVEVLQAVAKRFGHTFTMEQQLVGGASIDAHGTALSEDTLKVCQKSNAVLLGAVGGPKWDDPRAKVRPLTPTSCAGRSRAISAKAR